MTDKLLRKTRRRFVVIIMAIIFFSLNTIFAAIFLSTRQSLEMKSLSELQSILAATRHTELPSTPNNLNQLSFLYLEVDGDGDIVEQRGLYSTLSDADKQAIAARAAGSASDSGVISDYSLRYEKVATDSGWKIAFVDISSEVSVLKTLAKNFLLIGAPVLLFFFGVSVILSKQLLKPLKLAMVQQKRFIAEASHELKTPLTVILANLKMLQEQKDSPPENRRRWLDSTYQESDRMRRLTESLLSQARADNVDKKSSFEPVDISYLVKECALLFEPVMFEAGRSLGYRVEDGLKVNGNADQLRQLISALLDNAHKYSYPQTEVRLRLEKSGRRGVRIDVESFGDTIPPEKQAKLFERFYRADESRSADSGSFGLGLAIAQSIAAAHDGSITVESENNRTVFTVALPRLKS